MLGEEDAAKDLALVRDLQPNTALLELTKRRALYSLKNAVFFVKNNIQCSDLPLSNIALEVAKFSQLVKFISKDAGIKTSISQKFGDVALKELEALVIAHEVSSFS